MFVPGSGSAGVTGSDLGTEMDMEAFSLTRDSRTLLEMHCTGFVPCNKPKMSLSLEVEFVLGSGIDSCRADAKSKQPVARKPLSMQ